MCVDQCPVQVEENQPREHHLIHIVRNLLLAKDRRSWFHALLQQLHLVKVTHDLHVCHDLEALYLELTVEAGDHGAVCALGSSQAPLRRSISSSV